MTATGRVLVAGHRRRLHRPAGRDRRAGRGVGLSQRDLGLHGGRCSRGVYAVRDGISGHRTWGRAQTDRPRSVGRGGQALGRGPRPDPRLGGRHVVRHATRRREVTAMVRMVRKAQVDSSDGARVREWIGRYTGYMAQADPERVSVTSWMEAYGAYGKVYWMIDAPDLGTLDDVLWSGCPPRRDTGRSSRREASCSSRARRATCCSKRSESLAVSAGRGAPRGVAL